MIASVGIKEQLEEIVKENPHYKFGLNKLRQTDSRLDQVNTEDVLKSKKKQYYALGNKIGNGSFGTVYDGVRLECVRADI